MILVYDRHRFFGFFLSLWLIPLYVAFSRFGDALVKHTPLSGLIAFQVFRVLAEAVLWLALHEGLAPRQMTFEGYNFDIVTALTAVPVAWWAARHGAGRVVWLWNVMGFCFLLVIGVLAMTSMPTPLRLFMDEPSMIWVTRLPYTLLPGVLVTAAICGHLVIFRKLRYCASLSAMET